MTVDMDKQKIVKGFSFQITEFKEILLNYLKNHFPEKDSQYIIEIDDIQLKLILLKKYLSLSNINEIEKNIVLEEFGGDIYLGFLLKKSFQVNNSFQDTPEDLNDTLNKIKDELNLSKEIEFYLI